MSHITEIKTLLLDLDALAAAAEYCGCELVRDKKEYKWFGTSVGDTPLPTGFTVQDLGKCDHVIKVKNAEDRTYEIGVVKRRDGKEGYSLLFDYWDGGKGLCAKVGGSEASLLTRRYSAEAAERELTISHGYACSITTNEAGEFIVQGTK
jgi:hypothetical protein